MNNPNRSFHFVSPCKLLDSPVPKSIPSAIDGPPLLRPEKREPAVHLTRLRLLQDPQGWAKHGIRPRYWVRHDDPHHVGGLLHAAQFGPESTLLELPVSRRSSPALRRRGARGGPPRGCCGRSCRRASRTGAPRRRSGRSSARGASTARAPTRSGMSSAAIRCCRGCAARSHGCRAGHALVGPRRQPARRRV